MSFSTIICYIHLQIFSIEFLEDNIHSMRYSSTQGGVLQNIYLCDHLKKG
jgi:hypothetical protein